MKRILQFGIRYFHELRFKIAMILILTIISSMLSVTAPYLLGLFFDALIASASIVRIMYICLIYLLLMTCTLFVGYELNLLKVKVHTKASYRLNSEVLFYIHRLPYDTTMFMDSSYYTQRINNDATQIISYILEALSGIIINVVSIILPSVVIFNIFPPILPGIFLRSCYMFLRIQRCVQFFIKRVWHSRKDNLYFLKS